MSRERTTREEVVEQLRDHADALDARTLSLREAADETRRVARDLELDGFQGGIRTDGGTGAVSQVRAIGAAGVELTERALGNLLYVLTLGLWMAAGASSSNTTTLVCLIGGIVTLGVANRLKGWSA